MTIKKALNKIAKFLKPVRVDDYELESLEKLPRYTSGEFRWDKSFIKFPDAGSFLSIYREIFNSEIYKFRTKNENPLIIDCGANIGLSVIYFRQLYPAARIIAFEPDDEIFSYLKRNIQNLIGTSNINLYKKALWNYTGTLEFKNEGADAGRVVFKNDVTSFKAILKVEAVKLSDFINERVSFLKIDIEGSEFVVIEEIETKLHLVDNLFIEYHSFEKLPQILHKILVILSNNNFRYYLDTPSRFKPHPYIDQNTFLAFDSIVNIYAIRK